MRFSGAPKFTARWTTAGDGTRHPSIGQAKWWDGLKLLERVKKIFALQREPSFDLYVARDCAYCRDHGVKIGIAKADAAYDDTDGARHVVDYKGGEGETDISKFKRKFVAARFGVEIELVGPEAKRAANQKAMQAMQKTALAERRKT